MGLNILEPIKEKQSGFYGTETASELLGGPSEFPSEPSDAADHHNAAHQQQQQ